MHLQLPPQDHEKQGVITSEKHIEGSLPAKTDTKPAASPVAPEWARARARAWAQKPSRFP